MVTWYGAPESRSAARTTRPRTGSRSRPRLARRAGPSVSGFWMFLLLKLWFQTTDIKCYVIRWLGCQSRNLFFESQCDFYSESFVLTWILIIHILCWYSQCQCDGARQHHYSGHDSCACHNGGRIESVLYEISRDSGPPHRCHFIAIINRQFVCSRMHKALRGFHI